GFVAHVDDADAALLGAHEDRGDVAPAEREHVRDAVLREHLTDDVAAMSYRHAASSGSPERAAFCTLRPWLQTRRARPEGGSARAPTSVRRARWPLSARRQQRRWPIRAAPRSSAASWPGWSAPS